MEGTQWARAMKSSSGINYPGKFRPPHCSALQHIMTLLFHHSAHSKNCQARLWHKMYYFYKNKMVIFPHKTTQNNFQNYLIEKMTPVYYEIWDALFTPTDTTNG